MNGLSCGLCPFAPGHGAGEVSPERLRVALLLAVLPLRRAGRVAGQNRRRPASLPNGLHPCAGTLPRLRVRPGRFVPLRLPDPASRPQLGAGRHGRLPLSRGGLRGGVGPLPSWPAGDRRHRVPVAALGSSLAACPSFDVGTCTPHALDACAGRWRGWRGGVAGRLHFGAGGGLPAGGVPAGPQRVQHGGRDPGGPDPRCPRLGSTTFGHHGPPWRRRAWFGCRSCCPSPPGPRRAPPTRPWRTQPK